MYKRYVYFDKEESRLVKTSAPLTSDTCVMLMNANGHDANAIEAICNQYCIGFMEGATYGQSDWTINNNPGEFAM